jgi:sugar lactone lactonase YvrE
MSIVSVLPSSFEPFGLGLHRPECVLGTPAGDIVVPDWRGGVSVVRADGRQESRLARDLNFELRPNGVALADDGAFLLANLGEAGGVWRLDRQGTLTPWLLEVDGVTLPPVNFVTIGTDGRTWITVSTRCRPRQLAWRADVADGFIVLADERGARIVADGLHYTNECRPDPDGRWLYAVETFGRRLTRFPIDARGTLGPPEVVLTLGHGCWPDGFAFDAERGVWVTSLISNRLLRFDGDTLHTILEEANTAHIDAVEEAFAQGQMRAEHLGPIPGTRLQHVTSIAFGGSDLRTAYVGCLHTESVFRFRSQIAGAQPTHWTFTLP